MNDHLPEKIILELYQDDGPIARYALYLARGNQDDARDLMQEAFCKIWERRSIIRCPLSLPVFAKRVLTNTSTDRQREKARRREKVLNSTEIPERPTKRLDSDLDIEHPLVQPFVDSKGNIDKDLSLAAAASYETKVIAERTGKSVRWVQLELKKRKERLLDKFYFRELWRLNAETGILGEYELLETFLDHTRQSLNERKASWADWTYASSALFQLAMDDILKEPNKPRPYGAYALIYEFLAILHFTYYRLAQQLGETDLIGGALANRSIYVSHEIYKKYGKDHLPRCMELQENIVSTIQMSYAESEEFLRQVTKEPQNHLPLGQIVSEE